MSLGVTNSPASASESETVRMSMTVGTPTAMTGTPRVSRSSASRWFPTPEPGVMPVSEIWIVRQSRSGSEQASASTAITASGRRSAATALTIRAASMPVEPSTPGERTQTGRNAEKSSAFCAGRCRVAKTDSMALGPTASGVIARLPSPTTSAEKRSCFGSRSAISSESKPTAEENASSSRRSTGSSVTV